MIRRGHARTHQKRLLSLQKEIFRALQREADRLLGEIPAAIRAYEKQCRRDFRGTFLRGRVGGLKKTTRGAIVEAMRDVDVSFVADYHTFSQAQRTALRLISDAYRPGERWFVGLEFVPSHFQSELDAFQDGKLDLETFHRVIRYEEDWGFPWKHYSPIFEWARENRVRLIALNRPKEIAPGNVSLRSAYEKSDLHERDRWAAGIITDLFAVERRSRTHERPRMVVLYGDLHVASRHIPLQTAKVSREFLSSALECVTVHQNSDELYWRLARSGVEHVADAIQLKRNVFHVVSGTPWAKLQSLVTWAEGGTSAIAESRDEFREDSREDSDDEFLWELETDYLSLIGRYGEAIAEFLAIDPVSFDSLTVQTIHGADFVEGILKDERFSSREASLIRYQVSQNHRIYIPRINIAYLGTPSHNGAAEMAALHLQRMRTRSHAICEKDTDDFFRLVIEGAFGFFGSLILNPRRKCDLLEDHSRRIEEIRSASRSGLAVKVELEARKLTLAALEAEARLLKSQPIKSGRSLARTPVKFMDHQIRGLDLVNANSRQSHAVLLAARYLGKILGKRLHRAILNDSVSSETVRFLCLARVDGARRPFEDRYKELLLAVQHEVLASSKTHSL